MKAILFSLLFIPLFGSADTWPIDSLTGRIKFTEVVNQAATKEQLYLKAKRWVGEIFNSAKAVTEIDDKEGGMMVVKGFSPINLKHSYGVTRMRLMYSIKLDFKDQKYRYSISDLEYEGEPTAMVPNPPKINSEAWLINWEKNWEAEMQKSGIKLNARQMEKAKADSRLLHPQYQKQTQITIDALILSLKKALSDSKEDNW
ncbi:DUF4468 domain-containing protein [Pedobacter sp. SYSU D00535]|uniref:DUF4468 domain-containing protein n=1 Tax=Pedobacter sp. SYSU D00535 TaxID=2810308 RepID=UPI001A963E61|nr:DUF4468 domain-containing protein [Pedobacter sp. SYSU D00535]